jgi:subtilisin
LLNLSLETSTADEAVHSAIKDAFDKGTVCLVAAGNGGRHAVAYPAAWDIAVAVSSLGMKGTYPSTSSEVLDEVAPYAKTNRKIYVSAFSNTGPQMDVAGPGEGIVSTLPNGEYGVMSGTSMACPAVTGVLASMLSASPAVLNMARDRNRSTAIVGLLTGAAKTLGFIQPLEGVGLIS